MALALHTLLGHLSVELATLLTLASGSHVTREYRLGHQLLLLVMVANRYTGTSRHIGGLRRERGGERGSEGQYEREEGGNGERKREREREREGTELGSVRKRIR